MIDKDTFNNKFDFDGSKGLIFLGDNILVYKRDFNTNLYSGYIDLPGGGREGKESPFETFKREIKEELNLNIYKKDLYFSKKTKSMVDPNLIAFFVVVRLNKDKEKEVVLGEEGLEFFIITLDDFLKRKDVIPELKIKVLDYLKEVS